MQPGAAEEQARRRVPSPGGDLDPERVLGRGDELSTLRRRLDEALRGRGGGLLLSGEPGIGKSTLLQAAVRQAADLGFGMLSTTGLDSESHLAYGGLQQMLDGLGPEIAALPIPRRRALHAAFGLLDEVVLEPFFVRMAVLDLLTSGRRERPLLLAVEDVQWLDRETVEVLAFVSRRLGADPVLLLASARTGYTNALVEALPDRLDVRPLDEGAAEALLAASAVLVPADQRPRLLDWARGNPLALVELASALPGARHGPADDPDLDPLWLPTTARLEQAFATRALGLSAPARAVLLVAALLDRPDTAELLAAAAGVAGVPVRLTHVTAAVEAGLLRWEGPPGRERLVFRHALVRSAVLNEASPAERQRAHLALAATVTDPDRRSWYRAMASTAPDEELADELEAIGEKVHRRGALTVALAAQRRAAALTSDPDVRARRLLLAAETAYEQGDRTTMEQLLRQVQLARLSVVERCRAENLLTVFAAPFQTTDPAGPAVRAAEVSAAGDVDLALRLLYNPLQYCYFAEAPAPLASGCVLAAEALGADVDDHWLLLIFAMADPSGHGGLVSARARPALEAGDNGPLRQFLLAGSAGYVGDVATGLRTLPLAVEALRRQQGLYMLPHALLTLATLAYFGGPWNEGVYAAAEATALLGETGQPSWRAMSLLAESHFAAVRGERASAQALVDEAEAELRDLSPSQLERARGLCALAEGRYEDAYEHLSQLFAVGGRAFHGWSRCQVVSELAEAAAACDRRAAARELLRPLEQSPNGVSPLLRAGLLFARAVLAGDDDAEELFSLATAPGTAEWPFLRARAQLAQGSWLRAQRWPGKARPVLRAARDAFDVLGAAPWGERARRELRAAGESSAAAVPAPATLLTPQELQIATLAASGLTNREIGDRLFLSHRTVGTHLYQVFPKLGISSRRQLREALGPAEGGQPPS